MAKWTLTELLRGQNRFGRLTVLSEAEPIYTSQMIRRALCRCDCGTEKIIRIRSVVDGQTKSCGCLSREVTAGLAEATCLKHGDAKAGRSAGEYRLYRAMLNRCYNPRVDRYPLYGGRGIAVCDEWRGEGGYERFLADVGRRPSPVHSLDRLDPNGDYAPGNVRWADRIEQANNKRNTVRYPLNGQGFTIAELARMSGLQRATLRYRLVNAGMSVEAAISDRIKTGPYAQLARNEG